LDVTVQAEIVKLFDELCSQMGTALVFITHDLGLVGELCDRILVLYAGRLVESAPVRTIFAQPRHPYTQALLDCAPQLGAPEKSLRPISGVPPPMQERPRGCHFAPRCRYVEPRCRLDPMALRTLAPDHRVRCVRAEELAS
jgi:oligopeptide/dipeptide ABC transporter ATP-binding protein